MSRVALPAPPHPPARLWAVGARECVVGVGAVCCCSYGYLHNRPFFVLGSDSAHYLPVVLVSCRIRRVSRSYTARYLVRCRRVATLRGTWEEIPVPPRSGAKSFVSPLCGLGGRRADGGRCKPRYQSHRTLTPTRRCSPCGRSRNRSPGKATLHPAAAVGLAQRWSTSSHLPKP